MVINGYGGISSLCCNNGAMLTHKVSHDNGVKSLGVAFCSQDKLQTRRGTGCFRIRTVACQGGGISKGEPLASQYHKPTPVLNHFSSLPSSTHLFPSPPLPFTPSHTSPHTPLTHSSPFITPHTFLSPPHTLTSHTPPLPFTPHTPPFPLTPHTLPSPSLLTPLPSPSTSTCSSS